MYQRLRGVSGVGSRTALQTSVRRISVRDLSLALVTGDAAGAVPACRASAKRRPSGWCWS